MFLQMLTIAKLKSAKGTKPYTQPLKVNVCHIGTSQLYTTDAGERREYAAVGLADTTDAIKAMVYDKVHLATMKVGGTIILMNYIFKNEEQHIIITKNSKVLKTGVVEVPDDKCAKAVLLANPPPADHRLIRDVKSSPLKTLVTIQGRIVSVSTQY